MPPSFTGSMFFCESHLTSIISRPTIQPQGSKRISTSRFFRRFRLSNFNLDSVGNRLSIVVTCSNISRSVGIWYDHNPPEIKVVLLVVFVFDSTFHTCFCLAKSTYAAFRSTIFPTTPDTFVSIVSTSIDIINLLEASSLTFHSYTPSIS